MTAHPGRCVLHDGWAHDVALIRVTDAGSGSGPPGAHACLPCLARLVQHPHASTLMRDAVAELEKRAAEREGAAR